MQRSQASEIEPQNEDPNERIRELTARLLEREAEIIERDNQLAEIQMSREWRLARLLHRIGSRLAPPNSRRERLGRALLSFVMGFDAVWNFIIRRKTKRNITTRQPSGSSSSAKSHKLKIAYVIPGTAISGGVAVVCEHANRLIQRGRDVSIISEDNLDRISWFPHQSVPVIPISQITEGAYDILVATGWTTAYTVQTLEADRKFYFVQSDESRFYPAGDFRAKRARKTYAMDFEFITMAGWIRTWLKNEYGKDAPVVPNGINDRLLFPDEPLEKKGSRVRVLLEGAINMPYKGMRDAFAAVRDLDCEVWCVSSSGKPEPDWKCDRFLGKVPFGRMRHVYSSCDLLLKMSRIESFCYPPLEMMACGGTAVVGKVTGIEEYIVDGYNALVVEQGDVQGAREAVKKLIENETLRRELTVNGGKTAQKFRWDSSIDILETIFFDRQMKPR
ncbi:MAG: glycosyltransferase family 4 protein [Chloroflexi bacterium]|nr:glycosyltransferase family 4 protein [Chloroflexota bacterium]